MGHVVAERVGVQVFCRDQEPHLFLELLRRPPVPVREREFFIDNLLVRIHVIIVMIRWTGLAPWEFERECASKYSVAIKNPTSFWNSCAMRERIFIELMMSDRKLKACREGSK